MQTYLQQFLFTKLTMGHSTYVLNTFGKLIVIAQVALLILISIPMLANQIADLHPQICI